MATLEVLPDRDTFAKVTSVVEILPTLIALVVVLPRRVTLSSVSNALLKLTQLVPSE